MSTLIAAWSEGATTVGSWTALNNPVVAERLALVGHDYVCLTSSTASSTTTAWFASLIAVAAGGAAPLVRVGANEPQPISKRWTAAPRASSSRWSNDGRDAERRYGPAGIHRAATGALAIRTAGQRQDADLRRGRVHRHGRERVRRDNIDDICSVPGVDAVYVGPADLAASLGFPPALGVVPEWHADAISKILDACARHDMVAGIHCGTTQQVVECAGTDSG